MFPPSPAASAARPLATVGTRTVKWTVLISSGQASDGLASKTCFGAKSWATIWKSSTPQRLKRDSRLSFAYRRRSQRTATQQFEIGSASNLLCTSWKRRRNWICQLIVADFAAASALFNIWSSA
jgi:hypothetical protein